MKEAGEVKGFLEEVEQCKQLLAADSEVPLGESPRHGAKLFAPTVASQVLVFHPPYQYSVSY